MKILILLSKMRIFYGLLSAHQTPLKVFFPTVAIVFVFAIYLGKMKSEKETVQQLGWTEWTGCKKTKILKKIIILLSLYENYFRHHGFN